MASRRTILSLRPRGLLRRPKLYDAAYRLCRLRRPPAEALETLTAGLELVRTLKKEFRARPHEVITLRPDSGVREDNRTSGVRLSGEPGPGAIYTGFGPAVWGENLHYGSMAGEAGFEKFLIEAAGLLGWTPGQVRALTEKGFHGLISLETMLKSRGVSIPDMEDSLVLLDKCGYLFRLTVAVEAINVQHPAFLRFLEADEEVREAALESGAGGVIDCMLHPSDHSLQRGVAHGLFDQGFGCLVTRSARADLVKRSASVGESALNNVVLFPAILNPKSPDTLVGVLEPLKLLTFGVDRRGKPHISMHSAESLSEADLRRKLGLLDDRTKS
ncbi:MAG: hypothetical protein GC160_05580 [Acidobacteria bacterium]|nr:hypothetical protein [Acidobacteriota bacterium]